MACKSQQLRVLQMQAGAVMRKGQIWRLLTASFLHRNVLDMGINTFALNSVGSWLESDCGLNHLRDAYIASAVAGNLLACLLGGVSGGATGQAPKCP